MTKWLRALSTLAEVLSSIPSTHMVASCHFSSRGPEALASEGTRHTPGTHTYMHAGKN